LQALKNKKNLKMILGISITEWVGYAASLVLIISFMMKNLTTLRLINSVGAILFIVYGVMLSISWPIVITNVFILMANIYYIAFQRKRI
jgi:CHASE2 domain-containing sensor protein